MAEEHKQPDEAVTAEELEETDGELLPDREVMTILPVPGDPGPPLFDTDPPVPREV